MTGIQATEQLPKLSGMLAFEAERGLDLVPLHNEAVGLHTSDLAARANRAAICCERVDPSL